MTSKNDLLDKCTSVDVTLASAKVYLENQAEAIAKVHNQPVDYSPLIDIIEESRLDLAEIIYHIASEEE